MSSLEESLLAMADDKPLIKIAEKNTTMRNKNRYANHSMVDKKAEEQSATIDHATRSSINANWPNPTYQSARCSTTSPTTTPQPDAK